VAYDYDRCRSFINDLAAMETAGDRLTDAEKETVLDKIVWFALTVDDFWKLDEKPGYFGYKVEVDRAEKEWHWKLRQVRNDKEFGRRMFDLLKQNEKEERRAE
jgi:hypothetical protein